MEMVTVTVDAFSVALHFGIKVLDASRVFLSVAHLMMEYDDLSSTGLLLHELLNLLVVHTENLAIITVEIFGGKTRFLVNELEAVLIECELLVAAVSNSDLHLFLYAVKVELVA